MKILFLTVNRENRVCPTYDHFQAALAVTGEVEFITRDLGENAGRWCRRAVINGERSERLVDPPHANAFDFIATDAVWAFMDEEWQRIRPPRAVIWADCHGDMVPRYLRFAMDEAGFEHFWPMYIGGTMHYLDWLFEAWVQHFPIGVDVDVFTDEGAGERTYPVLLSGAGGDSYPLRQAMHRQLAGRPYLCVVERPQESIYALPQPSRDVFANILAHSQIALVCSSVHHYPVGKYYEIPACGALLMGDWVPELEEQGFEPGVNMAVLEPDVPLRPQIRYWLDHPDLPEVAARGQALVRARHSTAVRAREMWDHMQQILTRMEGVACGS